MILRFLKFVPLIVFILGIMVLNFINLNYKDKILPNIFISGVNVGGLTKKEAAEKIKVLAPINREITLSSNTKEYVFNSNYFKFEYDMANSVERAYRIGRNSDIVSNSLEKINSLFSVKKLDFSYELDNSLIDLEISRIVGEEKIGGNDAYFIVKNNELYIVDEKEGISVDYEKLKSNLDKKLSLNKNIIIEIPFKLRNPEITKKDLLGIEGEVKSKFFKPFKLSFFEKQRTLWPKEVFSLVKIRKNKDGIYYDINEEILKKLTFEVREIVDNKPRAQVLSFEGEKVLDFNINQSGSVLDEVSFRKNLRKNLFAGASNMELDSIKIGNNFPKESYGINHLLGIGKSKFLGSINSRVHNLALAAEKINGTLVAPGEEFSFLKTVGPISSSTGFQTAYVISEGRTVLGEGGGVCQTSTTLFRAMLNSGVQITSRYPHAYRVAYYEQDAPAGLDASVYYPSLDLKFKNDTGKYILIQAEVDKKKYEMTFYLFGTKDGREVKISEPELFGFIPAPQAQYIEDKNLKPGEIKQIDFSASGITSRFERKVIRDGVELYADVYKSNYSPWKAIFLKGPSKKSD